MGHNAGNSDIVHSEASGGVLGHSIVGGLIGANHSGVSRSTAGGRVEASGYRVGGLVGVQHGAMIAESYATGDVTGRCVIGGLVAWENWTEIAYGYARVAVTAETGSAGGVLGEFAFHPKNYCDAETTGQVDGNNGTACYSTGEMQSGDDGHPWSIYAEWVDIDVDGDGQDEQPWDFGTSSEYPALKVDFNGDGTGSGADRPS